MLCNIIPSTVALLALAVPAWGQTVYSTDFTDLTGWATTTGLAGYEWQADGSPNSGSCSAPAFRSAPACLNFNDGVSFGPNDQSVRGTVTSPVITLNSAMPAARVTFWYSVDYEVGCYFDHTRLEVLDATTGTTLVSHCISDPAADYDCGWQEARIWLDPAWGAIRVRFSTIARDQFQNDGRGPFIDDLVVEYDCETDAEHVCHGLPSAAYPVSSLGNPVGYGSRLSADGSPSISGGVLGVTAQQIDGPGFALLLAGTGASAQTLIGNGLLCIPLPSVRRIGLTTVSGATDTALWRIPIGTPASPLAPILPGDSLLIQGWYRDVGAGNFTDALRIHFCQ